MLRIVFFLVRREPGGELRGAVPAKSTRTEPIPQAGIGRPVFGRNKKEGALSVCRHLARKWSPQWRFPLLLSVHFRQVCLF